MPDFTTVDFSDIFEEFFGFGGFGRSSQRSRNMPRRGGDLQLSVELAFEEAVFGIDKEIEFAHEEVCSTCQGSGAEPGSSPIRCSNCNGSGEVRQVRQTLLGSMVQVSTCPTCDGQGQVITSPCHTCKGRKLERRPAGNLFPSRRAWIQATRFAWLAKANPGSTADQRATCTCSFESSRTSSSAGAIMISSWTWTSTLPRLPWVQMYPFPRWTAPRS